MMKLPLIVLYFSLDKIFFPQIKKLKEHQNNKRKNWPYISSSLVLRNKVNCIYI